MNEDRRSDTPDRRENAFEAYTAEMEKRFQDYTVAMEKRLHRFFMKALAIFAVIGITSAVALFGFAIVLGQIKETRQDFVRDSCKATKQRHDDATNYITDIANEQLRDAKTAAQRDAITKSLKEWLKLIDLQAPVQNCNRLALSSTGDAKPPLVSPTPAKESP